jgi:aspartyl-tRNA(Asn)/glutamyl-tRNA(Gln) amidotransferase subunit A
LKEYSRLLDIQKDLKDGKLRLTELVSSYLHTIEEKSDLNIFLEVFSDEAQAKSLEIQQKIEIGNAGRLAGMVLAIKDNIAYQGHKVSASSKILEGFESLYSATAVERLVKEDAIIIGRTNCDEFAMGASNENSVYGSVKNPIDSTRVPGGSSGGSAAAVAAKMCLASLGSDTGGSIRQPASFCGLFGVKPTYGRVSRYGLLAYGSSFDQIGPLTHSIEDAAIIMEVISGKSHHDSSSSSKEVQKYSLLNNRKDSYKIGFIKEVLDHPGLDPEIKTAFETLITKLKADGNEVQSVSFPFLNEVLPTYYVLTTAEASSNLSRYDGIHFGYRSENAKDIESTFVESRTDGFGDEVKRRIMLGTFVLSSEYYDAYYTKGQKVRRLIKEWTDNVFSNFDFTISPTTPHPAFKLSSISEDPLSMYLEDIFTVHANLAGNPAISIPGFSNKEGLPFGIQVLGKSFAEDELFSFSKILDKINIV